MPGSFSTALSALNAHSTAIDAVGHNLANLNTAGFKGSSVSFFDLMSQATGGAEIGAGVNIPVTTRQFVQGSLQLSGRALDAAIQGDGFFVIRDSQNVQQFTRAGSFQLDRAGNLLTLEGERVQGWNTSAGVLNTNGAVTNIVIPAGSQRQPVATTTFSANLNLNAAAVLNTPDASFSTPVEVVDSLGATHILTLSFTKTGPNAWSYRITIPGEDLSSGTAGTPSQLATGNITFNSQGQLTNPAPPPPPTNGVVAVAISGLANGAADMSPNWSLYGTDLRPRITQYAQPSAVSAREQNGSAASELLRVSIADGGRIVAQYSNGDEQVVAQLAMASIRNPETLIGVGNTKFQIGVDTASPAIGTPNTGGRGTVHGAAVEASTVDLAREFTNLIVYQRGYQANSRVVTTLDEISQETLSIKR